MGNRLWPIIFLPIALDIYCTMSRTGSQGSRLFSHKSQRNGLKTCRIYFFLATHLIHLYKDDIAHPPKDQVGFGDNHQYWYKLFNNKTIGWSRSKSWERCNNSININVPEIETILIKITCFIILIIYIYRGLGRRGISREVTE